MEDPRPTDDLNDDSAWPFEDGFDEVTVRIMRYDDEDRPACFQAIAKQQDRTKIWGVGIGKSPVACLKKAISQGYERSEDGWPDGQAHGLERAPVQPGAVTQYETERAESIATDEPDIDDEIADMLG